MFRELDQRHGGQLTVTLEWDPTPAGYEVRCEHHRVPGTAACSPWSRRTRGTRFCTRVRPAPPIAIPPDHPGLREQRRPPDENAVVGRAAATRERCWTGKRLQVDVVDEVGSEPLWWSGGSESCMDSFVNRARFRWDHRWATVHVRVHRWSRFLARAAPRWAATNAAGCAGLREMVVALERLPAPLVAAASDRQGGAATIAKTGRSESFWRRRGSMQHQ